MIQDESNVFDDSSVISIRQWQHQNGTSSLMNTQKTSKNPKQYMIHPNQFGWRGAERNRYKMMIETKKNNDEKSVIAEIVKGAAYYFLNAIERKKQKLKSRPQCSETALRMLCMTAEKKKNAGEQTRIKCKTKRNGQ